MSRFLSLFLAILLLIVYIPLASGEVPASQAGGPASVGVVTSPEQYTYEPGNRRDPFQPVTSIESVTKKAGLPPLQRHDPSELRVIGIIWGDFGYKAMVVTPDGKGYTLSKGTMVGPKEGVVKKITKNTVIIEEKSIAFSGEEKKREVILELQSKEEILE